MGLEQGVETYQRAVEERFAAFLSCVENVIVGFSLTDPNQRAQLVSELVDRTRDLEAILPTKNFPRWLIAVRDTAKLANIKNLNEKGSHQLISTLWQLHKQIEPIEFSTEDAASFDFDSLFDHFRDEGRIGELFDELIDAVGKIIESGSIDSLTAINALKELMSALKTNRDGSLAAIKSSVFFAKYMKNSVVELLKEVPVLRAFVAAYEKSLSETEEELDKLETQLVEEVQRVLMQTHPHLKQLPEFADKGILGLPSPADNKAPTQQSK